MSVLVYLKDEKLLLKIQEGTGDNLDREDLENGMVDYVLFSFFRPKCLDIDQEREMEEVDEGGMLMFDREVRADEVVLDVYEFHFGRKMKKDGMIVLFRDEDTTEAMEK